MKYFFQLLNYFSENWTTCTYGQCWSGKYGKTWKPNQETSRKNNKKLVKQRN